MDLNDSIYKRHQNVAERAQTLNTTPHRALVLSLVLVLRTTRLQPPVSECVLFLASFRVKPVASPHKGVHFRKNVRPVKVCSQRNRILTDSVSMY